MPPNTQRLFFAIPLSDELQIQLINTIKTLHKHKTGHQIKWTPSEKLHVTLRFLGATKIEKIPDCIKLIESQIENLTAFSLSMGQLVTLPKKFPRIIALAVPITFELAKLFQTLEQSLISLGFTPEPRPFFPHITLGRARGGKISLPLLLEDYALPEFSPFKVKYIHLLQSETKPEGSIYTLVKKFNLAENQ
ncbi:MAG TPA: RNA 2',3'-cyclic phosphodiesterase [Gammaproteobacteria bacterium]|nr:RNA 2',3'-cyclic phosphodiesterase [Gammaproteobacteria bacterium]